MLKSNDNAVADESTQSEGPKTDEAQEGDPGEAKEGDPWQRAYDETKKRVYYYHPYTQEAFWIAPTSQGICVEKAPVLRRLGAAFVDTAVSLGFAIGIAGVMTYELEHMFYGQMGGAVAFMTALVAKDCVFEFGSRSLGKRLLGLEILRGDATIAIRPRTVFRNLYFPLYQTASLFGPMVVAFFGVDLLLMTMSKDKRRIGDRMTDTMVVMELPNRKERVEDCVRQNSLRDNQGELGEFYHFKRHERGSTVEWLNSDDAQPQYQERMPKKDWEPLVIDHPALEPDLWGLIPDKKDDKPKGTSFIDLAK